METFIQGEYHVNTKAEIGVVHLQGKEWQRLPAGQQMPGLDSPSQTPEGSRLNNTSTLDSQRQD